MVCLDFVGPIDVVYLLVKVEYFKRVVEIDLFEKADAKHVFKGLERWMSLRGKIKRIKTNRGMHVDNLQASQ